MEPRAFDDLIRERLQQCIDIMTIKNLEYSSDWDRLHNFKVAADMDQTTPERALWGMLLKHLVSVKDICDGTQKGLVPTEERIAEKLGDTINYMLLLEGLLTERRLSGGSLTTTTESGM